MASGGVRKWFVEGSTQLMGSKWEEKEEDHKPAPHKSLDVKTLAPTTQMEPQIVAQ